MKLGHGDGHADGPRTRENGPRTTDSETDKDNRNGARALFDFERLDVYRVAVDFDDVALSFTDKLGAYDRDQICRAARSIIQNICEGSGKRSWPDKRRYYDSARASAMECGSLVEDIARTRRITTEQHEKARELLLRLAKMLTKLTRSRAWKNRD